MKIRGVLLKALIGVVFCAGAAGAQRNAGSVPDVYVGSGNSFVITVPNLTKVAVGNPTALLANVISPTEVLIQGAPEVTQLNGKIDYGVSNLYVWSGDRRYMYRVVVIETSDTTLQAAGVNRIDVEPNKVVLYGRTADRARAAAAVQVFDAIGVQYEMRVREVSLVDEYLSSARADRATIEEAIRRRSVVQGMTLDDLKRSLGDLPSIYNSTSSDTWTIDVYRFEDFDVTLADGVVVEVDRRPRVPSALAEEATRHKIVLVNMTEPEMLRVLGQPPQPPTVTEEAGRITREFVYPTTIVTVIDGRVADVQSTHPSMPSSVVLDPVSLGSFTTAKGVVVGRAFRLRYINGAQIVGFLKKMKENEGSSDFVSGYYAVGHTVDGLFAIYSDASTIAFVESLVTIMDRPMPAEPISVEQTKYTIPAGRQWNPVSATWDDIPAKQVGFIMARFSSAVSEARRKAIAAELERSLAALPRIPFAVDPAVNLSGATLTITGTPEQADIMNKILVGMFPADIGRDLMTAVAAGQLLPGMTRQQVEAARGVKIDDAGRLMRLPNGSLASLHDLGDRAIVISEDILLEERVYPGPDQVRNALVALTLVPYLLRSDVERILGETPRRVTRLEDGAEEVEYGFGTAVYWKNRLENMSGLAGSEMERLKISVSVPRTDANDFSMLTPEEQQTVIKRGIVMTGMTVRDVARVVAQAPFNIRPGDLPNEKIHYYSDYEILFRDGVAAKVTPTGDNTPRLIVLKSRRASEVLGLIRGSFANTDEYGLTADTVSNRLIVRAPSDKFLEIERFAKSMDQQEVPQVLIEAKFVELNRDLVKQLGVQWALSTQAAGGNRPMVGFGGSSSSPPNVTTSNATVITGTPGSTASNPIRLGGDVGMLLGMLGGNGFSFNGLRYTNVDVLISALESSGDANVLSSPRIVTINNQSATLKSISRVYDVTTEQTVDPTSGLTTFSTNLEEKEVGITLDVNPTIGQDGIITLDLSAIVSRVLNTTDYGKGNNTILVNTIAERNTASRVMVRSGTPLVIGGLSSREVHQNAQQVPFLGSLPLIGHLFRNDRTTSSDVDLLIFLTARVVPPDGSMSEIDMVLEQPRPPVPNPPPPVVVAPAAASR